MKAEQLRVGDLFKLEGDWRIHARLPGDPGVIEERMSILVKPIQPTLRQRPFYIPLTEEVQEIKETIIRLN